MTTRDPSVAEPDHTACAVPVAAPARCGAAAAATARRGVSMAAAALLALAPATLPAQATFKVVQPDGSIVYTDRPPPSAVGRMSVLRGGAATEVAPPTSSIALPATLRALAQRQPVLLYTAVDCSGCDAARRLLRQRGIPYAERLVVGDDDVRALERSTGTRSVPVLTIGAQPLRGFAPDDWTAYLDAAGYPAASQLPRGWTPPPPRPLTAPAAAADAAPVVPELPAADLTPPRSPPPPPRGIRF